MSMLSGRETGMRQTIRLFLLLEGASFALAGLVHFGVLARGYEHGAAGIAESVIGAVLLMALGLSWSCPHRRAQSASPPRDSGCSARWSAP